jgi:SAM-dependent methyltransferase
MPLIAEPPGRRHIAGVMMLAFFAVQAAQADDCSSLGDENDVYTYATPSRDGTGKFYMGREISHVMGHLGAGWLERPGREPEERTDLLIDNLPLTDNSVVVDLGAGTGFFTLPVSRRVKNGRVIAVDIQPEMLDIIDSRVIESDINNIETVLASERNPQLADESVDLVFIVDAYHEFSHPREVMSCVSASLRPGGKLVLIEYRGEDPGVPIKPLHKMTAKQSIDEMKVVGLSWVTTEGFLPQQHFLVFEKVAAEALLD